MTGDRRAPLVIIVRTLTSVETIQDQLSSIRGHGKRSAYERKAAYNSLAFFCLRVKDFHGVMSSPPLGSSTLIADKESLSLSVERQIDGTNLIRDLLELPIHREHAPYAEPIHRDEEFLSIRSQSAVVNGTWSRYNPWSKVVLLSVDYNDPPRRRQNIEFLPITTHHEVTNISRQGHPGDASISHLKNGERLRELIGEVDVATICRHRWINRRLIELDPG
jgi:hypothetical protein